MTAAPLAMVACGLGEDNAALGIQWHVLAMFGPSFFTGTLIARFGKETIIAIGMALLAGCGIVALAGIDLANFWVALILLGVGWNFGFIGATTMLTETYRRRRGQGAGLNDFSCSARWRSPRSRPASCCRGRLGVDQPGRFGSSPSACWRWPMPVLPSGCNKPRAEHRFTELMTCSSFFVFKQFWTVKSNPLFLDLSLAACLRHREQGELDALGRLQPDIAVTLGHGDRAADTIGAAVASSLSPVAAELATSRARRIGPPVTAPARSGQ